MQFSLALCFLIVLQCTCVLSHHHKRSAHELHLYRKRYELQHRAFLAKCSEKIKARQLKRALSPSTTLHTARQESLLRELSIRAENATTNSTSTSSNSSSSCVLDGEVTQGPYHVLGELVRQNITEGQGGVPVTFDVDFVDYTTCEPLKNAWVDVWHANSTGFYSGFTSSTASGTGSSMSGSGGPSSNTTSTASVSNITVSSATMSMPNTTSTSSLSITFASPPQSTSSSGNSSTSASQGSSPGGGMGSTTTDELSFDRGIWKTDEEGHLTMYDTVPGWYSGRAVHTHIKVYDETSGYQADNGTFVANNSAYHTGQWFWPQDFLALLADLSPYSENTLSYNDSTKNSQDSIYPDAAANGNQAEMTITWINSSDIMAGVIASTVVGVNLTYSSVEGSANYWTGNVTEAESNPSGQGSSSSSDSATGTTATDGVARALIVMQILTITMLAGATSLLMLAV